MLRLMRVNNIYLFFVDAVTRRRFVFRYVGVLLFVQILTACMPVAQDDLSTLGNDIFSNLIRNSYSNVNLTPDHSSGLHGAGRLIKSKAKILSISIFQHKKKIEIINLFHINGGKCVAQEMENILQCEVTREWKLKNIGGEFDTSYWSDPAAKLEFTFAFEKDVFLGDLTLEIIRATKYKELRD